MKSIVIYYSYSGNTRSVAEFLHQYLQLKGASYLSEIKSMDESKSFFSQALRALRHKESRVERMDYDLSDYDLICIGTPVWAFGPASAVNAYLKACFGLEGKKLFLFATYGSGAGKGRCLDYMQRILAKKGAAGFTRLFIQQNKARDRELVRTALDKAFA